MAARTHALGVVLQRRARRRASRAGRSARRCRAGASRRRDWRRSARSGRPRARPACARWRAGSPARRGTMRAAPHEPHRRQDQAFLIDLARDRHRARAHAADVGVMRAIGDVERRAATRGRGTPATTSVMSGRCVPPWNGSFSITTSPGSIGDGVDRRAHRQRHRAEVHGHVIALRDRLARRVVDRARVVEPLLDVRREPVRQSVTPISSAIERNRFLKTSNRWDGSHRHAASTSAFAPTCAMHVAEPIDAEREARRHDDGRFAAGDDGRARARVRRARDRPSGRTRPSSMRPSNRPGRTARRPRRAVRARPRRTAASACR